MLFTHASSDFKSDNFSSNVKALNFVSSADSDGSAIFELFFILFFFILFSFCGISSWENGFFFWEMAFFFWENTSCV